MAGVVARKEAAAEQEVDWCAGTERERDASGREASHVQYKKKAKSPTFTGLGIGESVFFRKLDN